MSRESCHCVYVNYDGYLCPRHDDCKNLLYLSTPNSQIKIMGVGGFINTTKVTESNSCPWLLCCICLIPSVSKLVHLFSTSHPDIWTLVQFWNTENIYDLGTCGMVWIWVHFLEFSVPLKNSWTFTVQIYMHEESVGIGSKDSRWKGLSKISQILFWHVRGSISVPSLDILR